MGKWAKELFGQEKFGEIGIVVAGTVKPEFEKKILGLFDEVISSKDSVYHAHLVKKNGKTYPVVFNVYGAAAMVDVLTEMHDGGCRIVLFVGYAYGGFKDLDIGSIVIPDKCFHFEGIFHKLGPDRRFSIPDPDLRKKLEVLFSKEKIDFVNGNNISVPAVTFQLPHATKEYKKIKPITVEMELAACFARSNDIGIRAVGILIISDSKKISIHDDKTNKEIRQKRYTAKEKILQILVNNIEHFKLPPLPTEKEFNINEHLASIIETPGDVTNVYREKK